VGGYSEGIEASGGSGSRQTHDVGISPQKDRNGAEETLGEGAGGEEEGGVRQRNREKMIPLPNLRNYSFDVPMKSSNSLGDAIALDYMVCYSPRRRP
jgi:hypothetical protein